MSTAELAKIAFDMHEKKYISREELVSILQGCVNAAALENGRTCVDCGGDMTIGASPRIPGFEHRLNNDKRWSCGWRPGRDAT